MSKPDVLIDAATIADRVRQLGGDIERDYAGKDLVLVSVLTGSFVFAADLARAVKLPLSVDFLGVSSYGDSKHNRIHLAAAMAVMPVAGPASAGSPLGSGGAGLSTAPLPPPPLPPLRSRTRIRARSAAIASACPACRNRLIRLVSVCIGLLFAICSIGFPHLSQAARYQRDRIRNAAGNVDKVIWHAVIAVTGL